MALRSIGSSLVAKYQPGGALRDTKEQTASQQTTEESQPGSLTRDLIQQPIERRVPSGTEKVVTAQPAFEGTENLPVTMGPQGSDVASGMGMGMMAGAVVPPSMTTPTMPMMEAMAPNAPAASGAAPAGQSPVSPTITPRSSGANRGQITPVAASTSQPSQPSSVDIKANTPQAPQRDGGLFQKFFGGRVIAAPEGTAGKGYTPEQLIQIAQSPVTAVQRAAGKVGQFIDVAGRSLGNLLPERGISERLETAGGSRSLAATKSAKAVLRSILGR